MDDSLVMIYRAQYQALIQRRIDLINDLERINDDITKLRKEAKLDRVELAN